jgi:multidrug efflux pump subunit AcrA (membrane-fusion protein)
MIIFLMLALAFVPSCSRTDGENTNDAHAAPPDSIVIQAARIEQRDLDRFVEAVGTLDPYEEVTVSNQVEGIVQKVFVDLGDAVRVGQLMAQIDTRELELAVLQQQAALQQELARLGLADEESALDEATTSQVRQAEATFEETRIQLDRVKSLAGEGVLPKQQLDEQRARYDVAEATLRSARETVRNIRATIAARKASLALAEKKLADAKIVAPMAGFVKERLISEGQYLKATSPVATIVQNSPLKLHVEVPESAITSVGQGRPVQFTVDAFPGRQFEGKVSRLSPSVSQQSRTLKLEALVNNPDGALKPGLFARVSIHTDQRDRALVAPGEAVFTFAGLEKVFVVESGKVVERVVRTGARLDGHLEIIDGLKEGELVATSNLGNLQQGREVSVR